MRLQIRIGAGIEHKVFVILPDGKEEPIDGVFRVLTKAGAYGLAEVTVELYAKDTDIEFERLDISPIVLQDFETNGIRIMNCFSRLRITTMADLCEKTELNLLSCKNFGEICLREVKRFLTSKGLALKG